MHIRGLSPTISGPANAAPPQMQQVDMSRTVTVVIGSAQRGEPSSPTPKLRGNTSPEWVLVFVGAVTAAFIGWQSYETRKAAKATEKSVRLQEVNLRQWVAIENWKAIPYIPEGGAWDLHVQFDVVNPTKLPLTLNSVLVTFSCHGCGDQGGKIGRKNLVPPGKGHPVVTSLKITEEQLVKWEDLEELVFIVNGSVEFEDVLKKVRNQPFSGLIACSKKGGVRYIPPYGSGVYITDIGKRRDDPS
jgi:hypothetical protein